MSYYTIQKEHRVQSQGLHYKCLGFIEAAFTFVNMNQKQATGTLTTD